MHQDLTTDTGFTLTEVLVAMLLAAVVVISVASLFALSLATVHESRSETIETALAAGKLEELTAMDRSAAALAVSPADALDRDTPDHAEYLDSAGASVPIERASYVRRWAVRPSEIDAAVLVLRVLVTTRSRDAANRALTGRDGAAREVVLFTSRMN